MPPELTVYLLIAALAVLLVMLLRDMRRDAGRERNEQRLDRFTAEQQAGNALQRDGMTRLEARFEKLVAATTEAQHRTEHSLLRQQQEFTRTLTKLSTQLTSNFKEHELRFEKRHTDALKLLQDTVREGMRDLQANTNETLTRNNAEMGKQFEKLTRNTDERLKDISGQVEKRLEEGFEKTTKTFADVLKRLALIDEAQKKITELSGEVVSLQEVLTDKRSRGAFGEVQLAALVRNLLPEDNFALQYRLGNERIVDCMLFLPEPTGNVPIDSKFPLESYQRMLDNELAETERRQAERQFKQDVRKHIQDIAARYIIPDQTSDGGAMMFIPAEAVFAEIQAHHPDIVELSYEKHVWLCSPTTMMAILNTARAVIKDAATREQVHVIQKHLGHLASDFGRFRKRMDDLAKHIDQAHRDVGQVHISAKKISDHFDKIEKVELDELAEPAASPTAQLDIEQR